MKYIAFIYYLLILIMSFHSLVITIYDKIAAKKGKRRIPEKTLLISGFFGGATVMFITMKIIRHKTKHMKFMIILPLMTLIHIGLAVCIYFNIP